MTHKFDALESDCLNAWNQYLDNKTDNNYEAYQKLRHQLLWKAPKGTYLVMIGKANRMTIEHRSRTQFTESVTA